MGYSEIYIVRPSNTLYVLLEDTRNPAEEMAFLSRQSAEEYLSDLTARADLFGAYPAAQDLDWGSGTGDKNTLQLYFNNRQSAVDIANIYTMKLGG